MGRGADIGEMSVVGPGPGAGTVEVDDRLVIVDEFAWRGYALNPQASLVWSCLDGASPLADTITDLSEVLDVPRAVMAGDVLSVVRQFGELGLLGGVERGVGAIPIDIEFVDERDACGEAGTEAAPARYGEPYLVTPPNH